MGKNCAIIVAAGKGSRMGADVNKVFLKLKDNPILYYTLKTFDENEDIDYIVLVLAKEEIDYCRKNIIQKYNFKKKINIIAGGNCRQQSVVNGLIAVNGADIVLIHDGARAFVNNKIIDDGIKYAKIYGASACGVKPKDTIKVKDDYGFSINTLTRDELFCVQTPQCFKYDVIMNSHIKLREKGIEVTDDTSVVEQFNQKVYLYEGSYENIKITTPIDLLVGEKILDNLYDTLT